MHFIVSLQNPQPVVFVHTAQSVIVEHTGGGQLPDCDTNFVGEDAQRATGGGQEPDPDPDPDPQGGGDPTAAAAAATAALDRHVFVSVHQPQANAPAQSLQFL